MKINEICSVSEGNFYTQKLIVNEVSEHSWEFCKNLCTGKRTLHIGCSDYPIYAGGGNLHTFLSEFCSELVGCDTNGLDILKIEYDGIYYDSIEAVVSTNKTFDVILVPNVIEHLTNPGDMVKALFSIVFKEIFVLVPNYFISSQAKYEKGEFTEMVHPDHFAWYSPYTLLNLFREEIVKKDMDCQLVFLGNKDMIGLVMKYN